MNIDEQKFCLYHACITDFMANGMKNIPLFAEFQLYHVMHFLMRGFIEAWS